MANVKTALADVVRGIEEGTLDIQAARVLVYALSTLANVISGSDLEQRIAELEKGKP